MKINKETQDRAEELQKEFHNQINKMFEKGTYQDCMNVCLIAKIAELEIEIKKLKK